MWVYEYEYVSIWIWVCECTTRERVYCNKESYGNTSSATTVVNTEQQHMYDSMSRWMRWVLWWWHGWDIIDVSATWTQGMLCIRKRYYDSSMKVCERYVWMYEYMSIWEYMSTWVYEYMSIWVYEYMSIWVYEYMSIWVYEYMSVWVYECNSRDDWHNFLQK